MSREPRRDTKQESKEDRLLDHNYDGIQEYDNPLPRWWINIFWATIIFSALYLLNLPGIGSGKGRVANYQRDMAEAAAKRAALAAQAPPPGALTDASLVAMSRDPGRVREGRERFATACVACHREDGGGGIGPNLTDDFWIHGAKPTEILRIVSDGVPDKGMPTWSQTLKPDEISALVAFVLTLHDTHPPNPKEPQGQKVETEDD